MDLSKVGGAIWRRRGLVVIGVILGCCLAFLGMYKVQVGHDHDSAGASHPAVRLQARSFKTYRTTLAVLIDAQNAAMGRTDTPIEKPIVLAPTYAYFATDDTVMRALEKKYGKPLNAKIAAFPVNNSPVVQLTVEGSDPNYITKVAATAQQAFIAELESYQKTNNIPEESRIVVRPLGPASEPELVVSRQYEILAVLFMLPVIAFIGLALLVDNAKRKREAEPAVQAAPEPGVQAAPEPAVQAAPEPVELEASPEPAQATGSLVRISGGDR